MTTLGRVLHVARKDLRSARWFVLVHAAALAVGTQTVLGDQLSVIPFILVLLSAWLVIGVAVQADSATGPDVFWVTRPLSASVVFGAKVVWIPGISALGILAHTYVLQMHRVSAGVLLTEAATLVVTMAGMLALAVVLAAMTRDMSGFLAGSFGVLLLQAIISYAPLLFSRDAPLADPEPQVFLSVVTAVALLALAGWQYRARDARTGRMALVGLLLLIGAAGLAFSAATTRHSSSAAVQLTGTIASSQSYSGGKLQVTLHAPVQRRGDERALLLVRHARIVSSDGVETRVRMRDQVGRDFPGDDLLASYPTLPGGRRLASMDLTHRQLESLREGGATVVVDGTAIIQREVHVATMALDDAQVRTAHGVRVRLDLPNTIPGTAVAVVLTGVEENAMLDNDSEDLRYALVGPMDGDTLRLGPHGATSSNGFLVLPSARGWQRRGTLRVRSPVWGDGADNAPPPWPAEARLRVTKWQRVDSYPVRITAALEESDA